jgi:HK97 family phage major capsid protein
VKNEYVELLEESNVIKKEAIVILTKEDITAEDKEKAESMIADAEEKANRALQVKKIVDSLSTIDHKEFAEEQQRQANKSPWDNNFGKFLIAVRQASKGMENPNLKFFDSEVPEAERKDLAESVGSTGGFLVPKEFDATLLSQIEEMSIVRKSANVIPMARRQIEVPALKQDGTTAGQPHWFGGMIAFWQAEATTMGETEPAFRNVQLTAHELTAVTHASNNLLADSAVSLSALLTGPMGFPGVVAWYEDYAFLRGSGSGQPLGVINAPATITVTRDTASNIKYDDLVGMMGRMLPSGNAKWVAHITAKANLMLMNGPSGNPAYLWGDATNGMPDRLLGLPIEFTEKVPTLGSVGDIGLYDFRHYYLGDRKATTVESSTEARWLRNQTSWKVTHRVDGQPWINAPFTLQDGSSTISPFVILGSA